MGMSVDFYTRCLAARPLARGSADYGGRELLGLIAGQFRGADSPASPVLDTGGSAHADSPGAAAWQTLDRRIACSRLLAGELRVRKAADVHQRHQAGGGGV